MITIIIGTNRKNAISTEVALFYQEVLQELGVESSILNLSDLPQNFVFSALYQNSGKDPEFNTFRNIMEKSKKYVFIVPEYNGSFPGVLKTFIDGLSYPHTFKNKSCALVGISSGIQGAGPALAHLTEIFNYLSMEVLALKPKLLKIRENWENGRPNNSEYLRMLSEQAHKLIHFDLRTDPFIQ